VFVDLSEIADGQPKTELIYFSDAYIRSFNAVLLHAVKEQGKSWYIILDRTAFHPKGGGQPSDVGRMNLGTTTALVKKAMFVNGVVVHYVKLDRGDLETRGDKVSAEIDWGIRYKYMRRHTAAHLLDHCVNQAMGRTNRTLSSWLGEPEPYVDYDDYPPTAEQLVKVESYANQFIAESLGVSTAFVDKASVRTLLDAPNAERLPDSDLYRVVRIHNFEAIPCGGTHVRNTKEIGCIRLKEMRKLEKGFRLVFDVG